MMNRNRKERLAKKIKDEIFIKKLGKELREQEVDGQAAPRFWTIMDYKWVNASDGCGERLAVYDEEGNMWKDFKEFIGDYIDFREINELFEEFGREKLGEFLLIDNLYDAFEYIRDEFEESTFHCFEEEKISYIKQNTMFLTKEEAKEHLNSNSHHYTNEAHTYAMTAWRAPKVGRLLRILEAK
ncbi:MAG: hypothetical protein WBA84_06785 [Carnobacterium sp.]|uniref:hypothetical protein n=1 Tax=Carnobacterium sp. TaxID=48221 RepID=UPI003C72BE71